MILGCPDCQAPMVQRRRARDGHPFMGCTKFPKCRGTRERGDMSGDSQDDDPRHDGWVDDFTIFHD